MREPVDTSSWRFAMREEVDTSTWRFVLSNLSPKAKSVVPGWVSSLACLGLHPRVDSTVSHVLVSTEGEERLAVRTLKYLQAVASGLLVVSEQWVLECLRDSSALGRALDWEVRDEELEGEEGPRRAREGRQGQEAALLQGFEVLVAADLDGLARGAIEDLLARVGGKLVTDLGSFSAEGVTRQG